jgi:hypothetical protein
MSNDFHRAFQGDPYQVLYDIATNVVRGTPDAVRTASLRYHSLSGGSIMDRVTAVGASPLRIFCYEMDPLMFVVLFFLLLIFF